MTDAAPRHSPLQAVPSADEIRKRLAETLAERRALKDLLRVAVQIESDRAGASLPLSKN
ncbi:hypothetical protein PX52LOC_04722 [Limnoglobus roseus]|uniref:Uncharacterized protein n=1 Tax=Limnoglobus roseus TaxID=2598579 RepID=A0A5C1AHI6_9BACT|nr:hypothetical protein PX52LOC_04722 [Limnoglobus roseus]